MYEIDPRRLDLAREFKANPYGEHSPDLQYLLNLMRRPSDRPFHALVMTEPFRRWTLAVLDPAEPGPPQLTNTTFERLADAEWHVFKLRWKALTGADLPLD
jgi:N,N-dimethylformamidase